MTGSLHRRGLVFVSAALAGVACWGWVAGTGAERLAFTGVLRGFANPPFFIEGKGTREVPWVLRTHALKVQMDARKAPVVVSMGDDPDGVFQSSPPSPVDLAVVLRNLQRLGTQQAAIAMVLAWDNPDAVALKGLELVLNDFQQVIHAVPLARGSAGQAMPPALRRASLPLDSMHGDSSMLPLVNRVAVADVIFGGESASAGFSGLDAVETGRDRLPLLARWEDDERVVLAFPLLAVLAREQLPLAGVQVKLGESIQLGPSGPVVPIDQAGCMALPRKAAASPAAIPAVALIDGTPEVLAAASGLLVLRDDQSAAPRATREFSASLATAMAVIGSDSGLGPPESYRRLSKAWEVSLILLVGGLLTVMAGRPRFQGRLGLGILAALTLTSQWLAVGMAQVWLPGIPLLAALLAGGLAALLSGKGPAPARAAVVVAAASPRVTPASGLPAARRVFRSVTMRRGPDGIHEVTRREPKVWPTQSAVGEAAAAVEIISPVAEDAAPAVAEVTPAVEEVAPVGSEDSPDVEAAKASKAQRKSATKTVRKKRR